MLFKDSTKIELVGSHFENMLFLEICQIRISRQPYWKYAIFRDLPNKNLAAAILELCYL